MQGYFLAITKVVDLFSALFGHASLHQKMRHALFQNPLTGLPDFQFEKPRMLSVLVLFEELAYTQLVVGATFERFRCHKKAVVVVQATMTIRSLKGPFLDDFAQRFGSSIPIPSSIVAYHSVDSTIVESMLLVLGKKHSLLEHRALLTEEITLWSNVVVLYLGTYILERFLLIELGLLLQKQRSLFLQVATAILRTRESDVAVPQPVTSPVAFLLIAVAVSLAVVLFRESFLLIVEKFVAALLSLEFALLVLDKPPTSD